MKRVPRELVAEIEASGVPWHIEQGKRHLKIFVGNRLCGILPRAGSNERDQRTSLNIRAQVRRAIKEAQLHG